MIQGVQTCGAGAGYCMLGTNCSADSDFSGDPSGHCTGLRSAFSPPADFSCCQFEAARRRTATPRPTPTTTEGTTFDDGLVDSIVNLGSHVPDKPNDDNSQIVDIVAIITDSTGIVDIVTRPYTGPWPPLDESDGEGITLPFAKPGETFEPGSLVGLGGQNVNLGETDEFQAGDMPPEEELQQAAAVTSAPGAEPMITPAATTPATPAGSTPAMAESTAAEPPPPAGEPLGPLADVPVMDQSQDYIGEVDYDQHLMPALVMPIRPGTKTDGLQANIEGSGAGAGAGAGGDGAEAGAGTGAGEGDRVGAGAGDGAGDVTRVEGASEFGDDLLEMVQDPVEGSGAADDDVEEVGKDQQEQHLITPAEDLKQTAEQEQNKAEPSEEKKTGPYRPAPVSGGAVQHQGDGGSRGAQGSLSASSGQPVCGMMGSSLATLLARNRFVSLSINLRRLSK